MWQAIIGYLQPPPPEIRPSLFRRKGAHYEPVGQEIKVKINESCGQLFFIVDNPSFSAQEVRIIVDSSYIKNEMSISRGCNNTKETYCAIEIPKDMIDDRPKRLDTVIYIQVKTRVSGKILYQWFNVTFESSE